MDHLLLIVAWVVGAASLFLVADMIAADLVDRRAERVARRAPSKAERRPTGRR